MKRSDAQVEPGGIAERAVKFQVISATLKLQEQTVDIGVCRLQTIPANRAARLAERSRSALSTLAERRRRLSRLGPHPARSRCSAGTGSTERLCRLSQPEHRDEVDWGWRRLAFGFGFFAFFPMLRGTRACRSARALGRGRFSRDRADGKGGSQGVHCFVRLAACVNCDASLQAGNVQASSRSAIAQSQKTCACRFTSGGAVVEAKR